MTTKQYPIEDWEFVEDIENNFNDWFHGDYGPYSFRSEAFYTDCAVEDLKTREDLMKKWVYAAFYTSYQQAKCAIMETKVGLTE
jgi:hypothetical protein